MSVESRSGRMRGDCDLSAMYRPSRCSISGLTCGESGLARLLGRSLVKIKRFLHITACHVPSTDPSTALRSRHVRSLSVLDFTRFGVCTIGWLSVSLGPRNSDAMSTEVEL